MSCVAVTCDAMRSDAVALPSASAASRNSRSTPACHSRGHSQLVFPVRPVCALSASAPRSPSPIPFNTSSLPSSPASFPSASPDIRALDRFQGTPAINKKYTRERKGQAAPKIARRLSHFLPRQHLCAAGRRLFLFPARNLKQPLANRPGGYTAPDPRRRPWLEVDGGGPTADGAYTRA
ncbi:hypothetical protein CCHR01_02736 [Colletotrichum chrysophilum]|uniref:Uncharacterized protein n=1 Tax=Colletotrichum chrysophilum TaxID=1836956 RepID=A0AAD9AWD4_9PEZI|nr:hypothetical protein CCHR01_02736 [Colletotrichum chrysophilum]